MSIHEHSLLALMTTVDGLEEVMAANVSPQVLLDPLCRAVFTWVVKDYWPASGRPPTAAMLAEQYPGIQLPDPATVEETCWWLIERLQRGYMGSQFRVLVVNAGNTMAEDPVGALRTMQEQIADVLDGAGRMSRGGGVEAIPKLWAATDLRGAEQPRWLVKNRIPRGAVSLLVGDEGIGKSLAWVCLAAAVTTGKSIPEFGLPPRDPGHVIVVVTEDDWSTTVRPRLEIAGADLDLIRVICIDDDGSGAPMFPDDMHLIRNADPVPDLVVVDAWLDTVPSRLSVKDPQQARQALHPWRDLATTTGAAVLLLTHTNRVNSASARDNYGATSELRKKARMALFAQQDGDGNLLIGPDKANMAGPVMASKFRIRAVQHFAPTDDHDGTVPLLEYVGESHQTAAEHIADAHAGGHSGGGRGDVLGWLARYLADGPKWSADLYDAGQAAGFSTDQVKRAKKRLDVRSERDGPACAWLSRLPGQEGVPKSHHDDGQGEVGLEPVAED